MTYDGEEESEEDSRVEERSIDEVLEDLVDVSIRLDELVGEVLLDDREVEDGVRFVTGERVKPVSDDERDRSEVEEGGDDVDLEVLCEDELLWEDVVREDVDLVESREDEDSDSDDRFLSLSDRSGAHHKAHTHKRASRPVNRLRRRQRDACHVFWCAALLPRNAAVSRGNPHAPQSNGIM